LSGGAELLLDDMEGRAEAAADQPPPASVGSSWPTVSLPKLTTTLSDKSPTRPFNV
jgi:hypothetical protein